MAAADFDALPRLPANHQPLTPLLFLERAAAVFPRHTARAAEGELAAYLIEGARILAERADDAGPQAEVSPGYDDLRWFELPAACMA